ncbi:MAG: ABC transporter substrate-binding protein [Actinobacteria bacterium]|nr:ABC transporter substrate-binding protein [Actinomycetota bacterium]
MRFARSKAKWTVALVALALLAAACGTSEDTTTTGAAGVEMEFEGEVVNVFGAFVDADAAAFDATVAPFEEATGIDVVYEGSGDFETQIGIRVEGGNAPDIAMFPQPGLWAQFVPDMVEFGALGVDLTQMADDTSQYLTDLPGQISDAAGNTETGVYGGWFRLNTKSWLWIPVPEFDDAGYAEPQTWDELIALQEQILADGNTPWCYGIESAGATGWVNTDWMEDIVMRDAGLQAYDDWVSHAIPFNDPQIKSAAERLGLVMFPEGNVLGGTDAILATPFGDQNTPMFEDPPACYLAKQAGFITGFFPGQDTPDDPSDDVFGPDAPSQQTRAIPFPTISNTEDVLLGAGDLFGVFSDDGATAATVNFLLSPEGGEGFAQLQAGFLSPNARFDTSNYTDPFQRQQGELLAAALGAGGFRFDASDLMPANVGAGTFWTGMVEYTQNGPDNLDAVLADIEASWP